MIERALFIARQGLTVGHVFCRAFAGSCDGEPLDEGSSLVPISCDPCNGTGFVDATPTGMEPARPEHEPPTAREG
ncbi:hypothetical protein F0U61_50740 [Archangium violaceum]|uniref:hypothetical protein n=1 Tax=Archangium violaceum TaxID=83451 RepID=UPI002B2A065F|nr:hypothetical protein F0U61_50740 [Archangium violaceum]